jgi:hypothetical protein
VRTPSAAAPTRALRAVSSARPECPSASSARATRTIALDYAEEKTRQLTRRDILEYYLSSLDSLHPSLLKNQSLIDLRQGIEEMLPMVDVPEGKALTHGEIKKLSEKAAALSHIITDKMKG